jgi:hypothetical protein
MARLAWPLCSQTDSSGYTASEAVHYAKKLRRQRALLGLFTPQLRLDRSCTSGQHLA